MTSQFWWWVARSSGMVAGVLLALTLVWGLLLTTKVIPRKGMPAWLTDMHRMLGGLSVVFIGVHLAALFLDSYAHFAWAELFVPFRSAYRAGAVAWGIGAFWMLLVVEGTSLLQRRMPRRIWRGLHYLSYPVAVMVAIHAMTAGADSGNPVFRIVTFGLMAVLTALTGYRFLQARRSDRHKAGRAGAARRPDLAALRATAARQASGGPAAATTAPTPAMAPPTAAPVAPPAPAMAPPSGHPVPGPPLFPPASGGPAPAPVASSHAYAAPTDMFARPSPAAPRPRHRPDPASDPSSEVR